MAKRVRFVGVGATRGTKIQPAVISSRARGLQTRGGRARQWSGGQLRAEPAAGERDGGQSIGGRAAGGADGERARSHGPRVTRGSAAGGAGQRRKRKGGRRRRREVAGGGGAAAVAPMWPGGIADAGARRWSSSREVSPCAGDVKMQRVRVFEDGHELGFSQHMPLDGVHQLVLDHMPRPAPGPAPPHSHARAEPPPAAPRRIGAAVARSSSAASAPPPLRLRAGRHSTAALAHRRSTGEEKSEEEKKKSEEEKKRCVKLTCGPHGIFLFFFAD
ncbi:OJ1116_C07.10 [Oryza sativa Japonica Group]|uniref:OJ1116_C07.10 protein n=1 Tax=Oryza sativa subsp. japonica TaxID=39947 RepID=Q7F0T5_ORYSJ|nr:OJ1116_C07.10 [Oryza sativa Japonica Group]